MTYLPCIVAQIGMKVHSLTSHDVDALGITRVSSGAQLDVVSAGPQVHRLQLPGPSGKSPVDEDLRVFHLRTHSNPVRHNPRDRTPVRTRNLHEGIGRPQRSTNMAERKQHCADYRPVSDTKP